ncbi:hypothetical protein BOTBODRAFT_82721, partial [Botryobasidium botryosum FD-172 SS1]
MVGILQHFCPEVFELQTKNGDQKFRCTDSFVRKYLRKHLRWSFRRTTRAAQKVPANADALGFELVMWLVSLIKDHDIPAPLIVNLDQTNCEYAPGTDLTWTTRGAKQVDAVGQGDKRAFTLTPIISMAGDLLPFQAVYSGK